MCKVTNPLLRVVLALATVLTVGCTGVIGYEIARTDILSSPIGYKAAIAVCPEGKAPITGGYRISDGGTVGQTNYVIMVNGPESASPTQTAWVVQVRALDPGSPPSFWSLSAYAACVEVER